MKMSSWWVFAGIFLGLAGWGAARPAGLRASDYFLAVELPADARSSIVVQGRKSIEEALAAEGENIHISFYDPEDLHISIQLIGEIRKESWANVANNVPSHEKAMDDLDRESAKAFARERGGDEEDGPGVVKPTPPDVKTEFNEVLDEFAKGRSPFEIAPVVANARLEVWPGGYIVYRLVQPGSWNPRDGKLELNRLKKFEEGIRRALASAGLHYERREDFPLNGHISIAKYDERDRDRLVRLFGGTITSHGVKKHVKGKYAAPSPACATFLVDSFFLKIRSNPGKNPPKYDNERRYPAP